MAEEGGGTGTGEGVGEADEDGVGVEEQIISAQRDTNRAVPCVLQPNEASLHHAKTMHGSPANTSTMRRCGYTMRYMSTRSKFNREKYNLHQIYLAQGQDHAGNVYGDPTQRYDQMSIDRIKHGKTGH